ncbi:hypothetical protein F5884DRAFT_753261 [Xylogone sp. PMI_703]|nr:hypothetical protein F5884DRAFT_753261 [Xylogone sp. PMI_703]
MAVATERTSTVVSNFLNKDGQHDTKVFEIVNPAARRESVHRKEMEEIQTIVDRELRQDHYHISVQPITNLEVLPEEHVDRLMEVEHRRLGNANTDVVRQRLEADRAQFKDIRTAGETTHTTTTLPMITGEHVHHHIHEVVQPILQKEIIQPTIIHTMVPVHELHQREAKYHGITTLPPKTMEEYLSQGGSLTGRAERVDSFTGEPKSVLDSSPTSSGSLLRGPMSSTSPSEITNTQTTVTPIATTKASMGTKRTTEHREDAGAKRSGMLLDADKSSTQRSTGTAQTAANQATNAARNEEMNSTHIPGTWPVA